jgi:hypothetical protein
MKYRIVLIKNSDYCQLKPDDDTCHYSVIVEADSKTEAIMKMHESAGMTRSIGTKKGGGKILPEVWEIKVL